MTDDPQPPPPEPGSLQFDRAESKDAPASAPPCAVCQAPLEDQYYTVGVTKFCPKCRGELKTYHDSGSKSGRFLKATLLGLLAALVGGGLWAVFILTTNLMIGFVAIGLGWLVGVAVRKGSEDRGGRSYQFLALGLCYFAVATGYMGVVIGQYVNKTPTVEAAPAAAKPGEAVPEKGSEPAKAAAPAPEGGCVGAVLMLGLLYIGTPILIGKEDFFTFVFLGIALWEAWRRNAGIPIAGPFRMSSRGTPSGG